MMLTPLLTATGIRKAFNGVRAVDGLDVSIPKGSITALIGPNGSGKTTVLNMISGLLTPDAGVISLGDREITGWSPHRIARQGVGRTFQQIRLCHQMSVLDNVQLAFAAENDESLMSAFVRRDRLRSAESARRDRAMALLTQCGVARKSEAMGSELSHGQRRLVEIARALALEPVLLLLDEPMAGLSHTMIQQTQQIIRGLKEEGRTILFVEHNVRVVLEISDHVIVMDHGQKIAEGPPEMIRNDVRVIEAYLGKGAVDA